MRKFFSLMFLSYLLVLIGIGCAKAVETRSAVDVVAVVEKTAALEIQSTQVRYLPDLDLLAFEQVVDGEISSVAVDSAGALDGAPVLGYVFPTTLQPTDVGFDSAEGIVALAATAHPDFDDTPLWDEDNDRDYENDGGTWHSHWVVLTPDERVPGGLAVQQFEQNDSSVVLPATNPGMPMYLDSPGFSVVVEGNTLRILVPAQRVNHVIDFNFDAVSAYMQVNTSDADRPLLGVYEVYSVSSGDLSLPYQVNLTEGEA